MPTIIRATERNSGSQGVAFNLEDMTARSERYLAKVRDEALKIVARAQQEADAIRRRAEQEGRQAAMQAVDRMVSDRMATVLPALRQSVQNIQEAKQSWLRHWEVAAVRVSGAIAEKMIRRELERQPDITLTLIREALELAAGSSHVRILLNPNDMKALGDQVRVLIDEIAPVAEAEISADTEIESGSCRVETRFGVIDQQFTSQLRRIEEELTQ